MNEWLDAPRPLDPRITIVDVPVQTVAVLRFSGFGGEDTVAEKKRELLRSLATTSWKPLSDSVVYSYDPPRTLPFFRRNELTSCDAIVQRLLLESQPTGAQPGTDGSCRGSS